MTRESTRISLRKSRCFPHFPIVTIFLPPPRSLFREYRFQHIAGVVKAVDRLRFERMVVRVSKRQAYVRFAEVERMLMDERMEPCKKCVFVIFYRLPSLEARLTRLCGSFANQHPVPSFSHSAESRYAVATSIQQLESEIERQVHTLQTWRRTLKADLEALALVWDFYRYVCACLPF